MTSFSQAAVDRLAMLRGAIEGLDDHMVGRLGRRIARGRGTGGTRPHVDRQPSKRVTQAAAIRPVRLRVGGRRPEPEQIAGIRDEMVAEVEARRFGRMVLQVELAACLSNPFERPSGWVLMTFPVLAAALVWPFLPAALPTIVALPVAYLAGVVTVASSCTLAALPVQARHFAAAPYRWLARYDAGWAGAYAQRAKNGQLTLYSVWATPRSRGVGGALVQQILSDTRDLDDLWLLAVNKRAADFYSRYGFRRVRREGPFGYRMVLQRSSSARDQLP